MLYGHGNTSDAHVNIGKGHTKNGINLYIWRIRRSFAMSVGKICRVYGNGDFLSLVKVQIAISEVFSRKK